MTFIFNKSVVQTPISFPSDQLFFPIQTIFAFIQINEKKALQ